VISPIFEQLSKETPGVNFYKVDTDAAEAVAREVGIRAMPTFIAFQNGQQIGKLLGARPQELKVGFPFPYSLLSLFLPTLMNSLLTTCSSFDFVESDRAGRQRS
jgi:hypothetical protein